MHAPPYLCGRALHGHETCTVRFVSTIRFAWYALMPDYVYFWSFGGFQHLQKKNWGEVTFITFTMFFEDHNTFSLRIEQTWSNMTLFDWKFPCERSGINIKSWNCTVRPQGVATARALNSTHMQLTITILIPERSQQKNWVHLCVWLRLDEHSGLLSAWEDCGSHRDCQGRTLSIAKCLRV